METKDKNTDKEDKESLDKLMRQVQEEQMRLYPEIYDKELKDRDC